MDLMLYDLNSFCARTTLYSSQNLWNTYNFTLSRGNYVISVHCAAYSTVCTPLQSCLIHTWIQYCSFTDASVNFTRLGYYFSWRVKQNVINQGSKYFWLNRTPALSGHHNYKSTILWLHVLTLNYIYWHKSFKHRFVCIRSYLIDYNN